MQIDLEAERRNPERRMLEDLYQALAGSAPDLDERLADYTRELGLPSSLRVRDTVATVVWRRGWRNPKVAGRERAYILKASSGLLSGRDESKRLDERITIGCTSGGEGVPVRAVQAFVEEGADAVLYGLGSPTRHRPALSERRSIDMRQRALGYRRTCVPCSLPGSATSPTAALPRT